VQNNAYYDLWIGTMVFVGDCEDYIKSFNLAPELFRRMIFTHVIEDINPWEAPGIPLCPELNQYYCRLGSVACYLIDYGSHQFPDGLIKIGTIVDSCSYACEGHWTSCFNEYKICYEYINGEYILVMTPYGVNMSPNCPPGCEQSCE